MHLHWDGDNDSVDERNLSAALGAGVTPVTVDHAALKRVRDWIWTLPPPKYPYPIDQALAARGAPRLPAALPRVPRGSPIPRRRRWPARESDRSMPIDAIGTDRHRLDSYTARRSRRTSTACIRIRRTASRISGRPTAMPTIRSTASGCAGRTCTTGRCRRCATCSTRRRRGRDVFYPRLRRVRSGEGRLRVERAAADGQSVLHAIRHVGSRQRQQRTRLRHDALRRRQAGHRRVHEDVLTGRADLVSHADVARIRVGSTRRSASAPIVDVGLHKTRGASICL